MGAARLRRVVRRATRIRYDPTTLTEALSRRRGGLTRRATRDFLVDDWGLLAS